MGSPDRSPDNSSDRQESEHQSDQPPVDPSNTNHFVVFADMLGFAALTETHPIDVRMLRARSRPGSLDLESIMKPKNPLTEAFLSFHLHVKWGIIMAETSHAVTAITFSDSVFF